MNAHTKIAGEGSSFHPAVAQGLLTPMQIRLRDECAKIIAEHKAREAAGTLPKGGADRFSTRWTGGAGYGW